MTRSFSLALLLLLSLACWNAPAETLAVGPSDAAATAQDAAAPAGPVPAELPAVVARVNGEAIERGVLERALRNVEARAGGPIPADRRDEVYRGVLDQLITYRLLIQEGAARKIAVPDSELDARLGEIRTQFPTEDAYKEALAGQQMTPESLRQDIRDEMLITQLMEAEVGGPVPVADKDIADFYEANPEEFRQDESVRASHVLIRVDPEADEAAKQKARAEAQSVLNRARAGADFATLAREHSQDPGSAGSGGDLQFFARGQMTPAFDAAAFALNAGQLSEVVETPFGYHVIKVTEKRPARTIPLDEVRQQVREFLMQRRQQEKAEAFIEQIRTKSRIEILM